MAGTQKPESVLTKDRRIAQLARDFPERSFVSLAHHIDVEWLHEAFRRTRKDGARGIDEETAAEYAQALEANLESLLNAAKSGRYRAPPVKRVYIPKGDGKGKRPIGIPTFEDKVLQRAVVMLLEPLYEHDFHPGSYGYRPGRSAHGALEVLWKRVMDMKGGWVIELDIQSFFDTIDHGLLRELVQRRVSDGVILRLIGKWLNAGVMEDGKLWKPEAGSPQGGVISPLLANIYLHYVLDEWFEREVKPRLQGRGELLRYADDAVLVFGTEQDARRVLEALPKRFKRFGLKLHPEKTRLVEFRPPRPPDNDKAGSFDFLGFTHYWGKSRAGRWVVKRKTAKSRFRRTLHKISVWCEKHRHDAVQEQHVRLWRMLKGHYGYFGIPGNYKALSDLLYRVERIWVKWLSRRSQRAYLTMAKARALLERLPLPTPHLRRPAVS